MELKPISHFYNKRIYIVPPYQRGYSWDKKNIYDLLNDLKHAIQLESNHYTGTITIHNQSIPERIGISQYETYHLVDGQQRFTTITLILSYLLQVLKSNVDLENEVKEKESIYIINKGSFLFRYEIDKVSENYFRSEILEKENLSTLDENLYTRNLNEAKKNIRDYFKEPDMKGRELEFLIGLEERLQFNEYIVNTSAEIGVVFETMNNRGVSLSDLEIVKNRLLYLSSKINVEKEEHLSQQTINNINTKWAQILRNLTLPDRVLDENTFLSNHWIVYKRWSKDNQAKSDILDKEFTVERMVKDPTGMLTSISKYVNSLAVTSLHWRFINYPTEDKAFTEVDNETKKQQIKEIFNKLNRLSNSTVRPLLLSFIGLMKTNPEDLLEIAELAEIFSFRLFSMNKKRADTGKNDIFRNCHSFWKDNNDPKIIQLAKYFLAWYINHHGDTVRFNVEIKDLFDSSKKLGYYSWSGLVYFLYEYEEKMRFRQDNKIGYEFASKRSKSIEHIIPQNYKSNWKKEIGDIKGKELKQVLHGLGNLVLINADKNSSLRDSNFSVKRPKYLLGTYSEIEIAKNNSEWTIDDINIRTKKLNQFMKERWQLETDFLKIYPHPSDIEVEITDELDEIEEPQAEI